MGLGIVVSAHDLAQWNELPRNVPVDTKSPIQAKRSGAPLLCMIHPILMVVKYLLDLPHTLAIILVPQTHRPSLAILRPCLFQDTTMSDILPLHSTTIHLMISSPTVPGQF